MRIIWKNCCGLLSSTTELITSNFEKSSRFRNAHIMLKKVDCNLNLDFILPIRTANDDGYNNWFRRTINQSMNKNMIALFKLQRILNWKRGYFVPNTLLSHK